MSLRDGYDGDELRALAIALDVLDPADPDQWEGDEAAFTASVEAGRRSLEERGLARFARDGSAVIESGDADELEAFLAPLTVIEVTVLDPASVQMREWYVGPETTVVATRSPEAAAEQTLETVATESVFSDVARFLDLRGGDGRGESRQLAPDDLLTFAPPARLIMIDAARADTAASGSFQILDAETAGLFSVRDVEGDADELVEVTPAGRAEVIEQLFAALVAA